MARFLVVLVDMGGKLVHPLPRQLGERSCRGRDRLLIAQGCHTAFIAEPKFIFTAGLGNGHDISAVKIPVFTANI